MCVLENFVLNLQEFLTSNTEGNYNLIRKHTKKLIQLGDLSFPMNIENWYQYIDFNINEEHKHVTIFHYKYPQLDQQCVVTQLTKKSSEWCLQIENIVFKNNDAHIFIRHSSTLFQTVIRDVLESNEKYGSCNIIKKRIDFKLGTHTENVNLHEIDLSVLRLMLLKDISKNLIDFIISDTTKGCDIIYLVTNLVDNGHKNIVCGPVINEKGVKSTFTALELYAKRSSDMRMMAQHKYGVQVKPNLAWDSYFDKLGKASVTIEMLTNKPQKAIKICLNDLQSANKGASFIFYNCARLAALFKEFEKRVFTKEYPGLPNVETIDFSVLNQPEEWELFYVYILQFPLVIKSCIKDIEKGILNPQHLISFLSNLSSIFSVYYRRVRILTNPKEHMFSVIHARIYLLKALQCVFHNALRLLNIEPIKEM